MGDGDSAANKAEAIKAKEAGNEVCGGTEAEQGEKMGGEGLSRKGGGGDVAVGGRGVALLLPQPCKGGRGRAWRGGGLRG